MLHDPANSSPSRSAAWRRRVRAGIFAGVTVLAIEASHPAWSDSTAWVGIEWLASGDVPASAYDPATTALLVDIQRSSWAFIARRALGLVDSIPVVPLPRELVDPLTLGVYAAPHDMVYLRTSHHAPRTDATSDAIDGVPIGTFQVYVHELVHASQARDPEVWRAFFRGVPRQKDLRRYGAINPLEQQADAASWALTTLILERKGEWIAPFDVGSEPGNARGEADARHLPAAPGLHQPGRQPRALARRLHGRAGRLAPRRPAFPSGVQQRLVAGAGGVRAAAGGSPLVALDAGGWARSLRRAPTPRGRPRRSRRPRRYPPHTAAPRLTLPSSSPACPPASSAGRRPAGS